MSINNNIVNLLKFNLKYNKLMTKLTKKKKIIILFGIILLIACLVFAWSRFFISNDWQIQISDVSKNCYSNAVNVFSNKYYTVVSSVGQKVLAKGKSNYSKSIDYLENQIKNYSSDKISMMNYKIESSNGTSTYVDQNNSPELEEFIQTIKVDNLFWCD